MWRLLLGIVLVHLLHQVQGGPIQKEKRSIFDIIPKVMAKKRHKCMWDKAENCDSRHPHVGFKKSTVFSPFDDFEIKLEEKHRHSQMMKMIIKNFFKTKNTKRVKSLEDLKEEMKIITTWQRG